jgi:hypothetical protein
MKNIATQIARNEKPNLIILDIKWRKVNVVIISPKVTNLKGL